MLLTLVKSMGVKISYKRIELIGLGTAGCCSEVGGRRALAWALGSLDRPWLVLYLYLAHA